MAVLPAPLRSLRALAVLNVAAVGMSLGGIVGVLFAIVLKDPRIGVASGVSTTVFGMAWASLLRGRRTVGSRRWPLGWVLAVPLAAANAGVSLNLLGMINHPEELTFSSVAVSFGLAATFGAIFWIPALVFTVLFFGVPIQLARRHAREGLAGEERGEWIVGAACALIGWLAVLLAVDQASPRFPATLGVLGGAAGALAAGLALARERRRRAFVARVEAGAEPDYRVDTTNEGKVLIRVVSQGQGYRVADFEEQLAELGTNDEVTRVRRG